jgi:hypothetical protein
LLLGWPRKVSALKTSTTTAKPRQTSNGPKYLFWARMRNNFIGYGHPRIVAPARRRRLLRNLDCMSSWHFAARTATRRLQSEDILD